MPTLPVSSSTDGAELVPAPGARQIIRVKGLDLTAVAAVTVSLKSNNSAVVWSTSAMGAAAAAGIVLNCDSARDIDCLPGQSLNLGLSAANAVRGSVTYIILGPPA